MSSNETFQLTNAKKKLKNSIIITGIYVVTTTSYNLVRNPAFVECNVVKNTIDTYLTDPLILAFGACFPVTMIISNVLEYRKIKKEIIKSIGTKK